MGCVQLANQSTIIKSNNIRQSQDQNTPFNNNLVSNSIKANAIESPKNNTNYIHSNSNNYNNTNNNLNINYSLHNNSPTKTKKTIEKSNQMETEDSKPFKQSMNNVIEVTNVLSTTKLPPHETITQMKRINDFEITEYDKLTIKKALSNHFLFKDKAAQIISILIESLEMLMITPGTVLFRQGDIGNYFYIVKEGQLQIETEQGGKKMILANDTFGELALIESKQRSATVKCVETAILYLLEGKCFREIVAKINNNDLKDRLSFLTIIPIFNALSSVQLNMIASSMYSCEFEKGQSIISEGDTGLSLYIIKTGIVNCKKGDIEVRKLGPKDYFGEGAVLFETNRSMSIFALDKTTCYQISQNVLIENLGDNFKKVILQSITREALRNSKYMKMFANDNYFQVLFDNFALEIYSDQEIIIKKGAYTNKRFFVLISGSFYQSNSLLVLASRGEIFGDVLLKTNEHIKSDIIAQNECRVIEFKWDLIASQLNLRIEKKKLLSFFNRISHLKKIQIFRDTSDNRLIEICKLMKKEKYEAKSIIFKEGEMGDKLYLIKSGKVKVYKNSIFIRELEEGSCFGEIALLVNEPRSATVFAVNDVSIFTLTKDNFNSFIDKHMLNYLAKKISLQDSFTNSLNDLYFCKTLGKGKFGTVSLVHNNKNFYAIKAVSRKAAEKQKILIKYFIQERNILLKLDHPFVMKLVRTFKTEEQIFYMLEFIQGKVFSKFLEVRHSNQIQNVSQTQFYISFLLIMVDYLNSKKVCHRDLKPENIILDERGYLKLIDFGTCIELKDFTNTITGTPHYISPEVLMGKGYSFSCDYWSIGIIAHEVYYNCYPFGQSAKDPIDVYREVVKKELTFPNGNAVINNFIQAFLRKKVAERVCSLDKAKGLELFKEFKWNEVIDLQISPPFVPKLSPMKEFKFYNIKYSTYLKSEASNQKNNNNSILSSYDEDDNKNEQYDPNWADQF